MVWGCGGFAFGAPYVTKKLWLLYIPREIRGRGRDGARNGGNQKGNPSENQGNDGCDSRRRIIKSGEALSFVLPFCPRGHQGTRESSKRRAANDRHHRSRSRSQAQGVVKMMFRPCRAPRCRLGPRIVLFPRSRGPASHRPLILRLRPCGRPKKGKRRLRYRE